MIHGKFLSLTVGNGGGKFLQRGGERLRVKIWQRLRELEKLVQLRIGLMIVFGGKQAVKRQHEPFGAAGVQRLRHRAEALERGEEWQRRAGLVRGSGGRVARDELAACTGKSANGK